LSAGKWVERLWAWPSWWGSLDFVALTDTQDCVSNDRALHVDHFGLSIGSVSVGLPRSCTADDVYRRYLDLMALLQRGPMAVIEAPQADLEALSDATSADCTFVARRLASLQTGSR
jgi:hypothetical protein